MHIPQYVSMYIAANLLLFGSKGQCAQRLGCHHGNAHPTLTTTAIVKRATLPQKHNFYRRFFPFLSFLCVNEIRDMPAHLQFKCENQTHSCKQLPVLKRINSTVACTKCCNACIDSHVCCMQHAVVVAMK